MERKICFNNRHIFSLPSKCGVNDINLKIEELFGLQTSEFYLLQNGKRYDPQNSQSTNILVCLSILGGKGGFGSMLRAIGAQIEKTTNREACRDLSGRRLRDINEEKRLKTWLDGQKDREQEAEDKRKKKIAKLQAKPKHVFKDEAYEQARSELTENIASSVEEGFKKANQASCSEIAIGSKRKLIDKVVIQKKKKKGDLWLGNDMSSSSDTDTNSESDSEESTQLPKSIQSPSNTEPVCSKSLTSDESSVDK